MHAVMKSVSSVARAFYEFTLAQKVLFVGAMVLSYLSPVLGIVAYVVVRVRKGNRAYRFALLAGLVIAVIWYVIDFALFVAGVGA